MLGLLERLKHFFFPDQPLQEQIRRTYFSLRVGVGTIGLLLPIVLTLVGVFVDRIAWRDVTSLSAFYWLPGPPRSAPLRDWFVGSLFAIACCLVVYKGYSRLEDLLLNGAGAALVVVALCPMTWPSTCGAPDAAGTSIHGIAATCFFFLIAATVLFCADATLHFIPDARVERRWRRIYRTLAFLMIIAPLGAYLLSSSCAWMFAVETAGVVCFSMYWFFKSYELAHQSRLEAGTDAPGVEWTDGRLLFAFDPRLIQDRP
jgi:hypothetical protein